MCIIKNLIDKGARNCLHHHAVTPPSSFSSTRQCPNRRTYPNLTPYGQKKAWRYERGPGREVGKYTSYWSELSAFQSVPFFSSSRESWTKGSFAVVARGDLYPLPMCQRNAGDSLQHNSHGQSNSSSFFSLWFCNYCLLLVVDSSFIISKIVGVKTLHL